MVWLLDLLVRDPQGLKSGLDLILWGRDKECYEFSEKLGLSLS
jgi:hypothetical protein